MWLFQFSDESQWQFERPTCIVADHNGHVIFLHFETAHNFSDPDTKVVPRRAFQNRSDSFALTPDRDSIPSF